MDKDFVTLGMFIIDDIYPPREAPDQTPQKDIIGGAGTYSAIGARLFSPPPQSETVGWIVDAGTDFPSELRSIINSWQTGALMRERLALTTRGWNGYSGNQHRAFKYLTEKKRLTADDLTDSLLAANSFHLICSPLRCIEQVEGILDRRRTIYGEHIAAPIFIWEPVPDLCTPDELENTFKALKHVDVISPNHEELAALFSYSHANGVSKKAVEEHAERLLSTGVGSSSRGGVVIRSGAEGCYVQTNMNSQWIPAYHQDPSKVIDPTGGGNGFLGGLAVGLVRTDFDLHEAAKWGSVAASFCIEQVGMPHLQAPTGNEHSETWNGVNVLERLREYRHRMA